MNSKDTQYLFIDMNSFFASCEQEKDKSLRNKPVAVTPVNVPTGCIIAASYEAKKMGVKTGTRVGEAKIICPEIIIKQSNVNLYLSFHEKMIKTLYDFSPFVTIKSIDEAVIKLTPSEQNSQKALGLAINIKRALKQNLGECMNASIGIGPNAWLAKMAAESKKPDGLVELKIKDLPMFFKSLKLTDLKGINFHLAKRLNGLGIYRPIDLFNTNVEILRHKMGLAGDYWHLRMHGAEIDTSDISATGRSSFGRKTIGHSHVLAPIMRTWPKAWAVCQKLAEKTARRLRENKLTARKIQLVLSFVPHDHWKKTVNVLPFSDSQTITRIIYGLWQEIPQENQPIKIAITVSNLEPNSQTRKLFPAEERLDKLYVAVDKINDRYGAFTIKPATILIAHDAAPNRISFGKPIF